MVDQSAGSTGALGPDPTNFPLLLKMGHIQVWRCSEGLHTWPESRGRLAKWPKASTWGLEAVPHAQGSLSFRGLAELPMS